MTYHRLMIGLALLLAAVLLRVYLPETGAETVRQMQALIGEQQYALPREAAAWIQWR